VHARFGFADDDPSPVDVLVRLAYDLSRKWRHRAQARFLRFTVALIAIGAELTTTDRHADRQQLLRLLDEFKRGRWPGRLDPLVNVVVKLLLANFDGNAEHWPEVVDQIAASAQAEHIAAVTGVGVSLEATRNAVAELSRHGIVTIGATVTADDMNTDADHKRIKNFFRVGPTNSDEAHAAVNYIAKLGGRRTMLVADVNEADTYATTPAKAFQEQQQVQFSKKYDSLEGQLTGASRDQYLQKLFRGMHSDICTAQPDVIYFAGRGVDLRSFITVLSNDGACQQLPSVTVISGEDVHRRPGRADLPAELHGLLQRLRHDARVRERGPVRRRGHDRARRGGHRGAGGRGRPGRHPPVGGELRHELRLQLRCARRDGLHRLLPERRQPDQQGAADPADPGRRLDRPDRPGVVAGPPAGHVADVRVMRRARASADGIHAAPAR
jgi:hypothetical protein